MLKEKLKKYHIILASGSPRRHHFFKELDIDFTIDVREIEEVYPPHLKASEITDESCRKLLANPNTETYSFEIVE